MVDVTALDVPRPLSRLQFVRDVVMARILFHEVGHHLQATAQSLRREAESGAEAWRVRLSRIHFRRHYWFLRPIVRLLAPVQRRLKARRARRSG